MATNKVKYFKHTSGGKMSFIEHSNVKHIKHSFINWMFSTNSDDAVEALKKTEDFKFGLILECDANGKTEADRKEEIKKEKEIEAAVNKASKEKDAEIERLKAMLKTQGAEKPEDKAKTTPKQEEAK